MVPARICGVSMLPPKRSGTSELRTSPAGRGDADRAEHRLDRQLDRRSLCRAAKVTVFRARSSS